MRPYLKKCKWTKILLYGRHIHDFSSLAKFCGIHHCVLFAYFHHIKFCFKKIRLELFLLEPPKQSAHEGKTSCFPSTDCQKLTEWTMNINVILYVKCLAAEVAVDAWGEEWKDCVV